MQPETIESDNQTLLRPSTQRICPKTKSLFNQDNPEVHSKILLVDQKETKY
jgi:hypothetical protein